MKAADIKKLIKNELETVLAEDAEKISKSLEELHKVVIENSPCQVEMVRKGKVRYYKSLTLENVSKLIEIPVNNLMLYFLNGQRLKQEDSPIEMRQHVVYFYKEEK